MTSRKFWECKPGAQVALNKVLLCAWLGQREGVPIKALSLSHDLSQTRAGCIEPWCGNQILAFQNQNNLPINPVLTSVKYIQPSAINQNDTVSHRRDNAVPS